MANLIRAFILAISFILFQATTILTAGASANASDAAKSTSTTNTKLHEGTEGSAALLTSSDIQKLVTILEDSTQRKEFLKTLRLLAKVQESQRPSQYLTGEGGLLFSLIQPIQAGLTSLSKWTKVTFSDIQNLPKDFESIRNNTQDVALWKSLTWFVFGLILAIGIGLLVELCVRLLLRNHRPRPVQPFFQTCVLTVFEWIPTIAFAVTALLTASFVFEAESQSLISASSCLVATLLVRLYSQALRCSTLFQGACLSYNRIIASVALGIFIAIHGLVQLGLSEGGYQSLLRLFGLSILALLIAAIFACQRDVSQAINPVRTESLKLPFIIRTLTLWLTESWPLWATLVLVLFYTAWVADDSELLMSRLIAAGSIVVFISALMLSPRCLIIYRDLSRGRTPTVTNALMVLLPVCQVILFLGLLSGILKLFGLNILYVLTDPMVAPYATALVSIIVILVVAWTVWFVANAFINSHLHPKSPKGNPIKPTVFVRTFFPILRSTIHWGIVIFTTILVLQEMGFPVVPLLYGVSVLGLAISLGCQNLVKDVINGFLTLMEGVISVGELVKLGENTGTIEAISLRGLKLRHGSGALQTIPFSEITSIINLSRDYSVIPIQLSLPFRTDIGQVSELLSAAFDDIKNDSRFSSMILEPLQIRGIEKFSTNAVLLSAVIKVRPDPSAHFAQEFNRFLKERMNQARLETV
jgi:moderate conductance mechanosensitive channel